MRFGHCSPSMWIFRIDLNREWLLRKSVRWKRLIDITEIIEIDWLSWDIKGHFIRMLGIVQQTLQSHLCLWVGYSTTGYGRSQSDANDSRPQQGKLILSCKNTISPPCRKDDSKYKSSALCRFKLGVCLLENAFQCTDTSVFFICSLEPGLTSTNLLVT